MRVSIRVPATVANLGPGFDILALALQLQNDVVCDEQPQGRIDEPQNRCDPHMIRHRDPPFHRAAPSGGAILSTAATAAGCAPLTMLFHHTRQDS